MWWRVSVGLFSRIVVRECRIESAPRRLGVHPKDWACAPKIGRVPRRLGMRPKDWACAPETGRAPRRLDVRPEDWACAPETGSEPRKPGVMQPRSGNAPLRVAAEWIVYHREDVLNDSHDSAAVDDGRPQPEFRTMAKEFRLPDLGEGVHEGQIIKLLVKEGDPVQEDQPLMEVETDKAAVEIPSPASGTIAKWHVEENQTVNVGDVMVTFGEAGGAKAKSAGTSESETSRTQTKAAGSAASSSGGGTATAAPSRHATGTGNGTGNGASGGRRKPASPAVRKLARQMEIDIEIIPGSGPGGRVTRTDVESFVKDGGASSQPSTAKTQRDSRKPQSPPTKQIAHATGSTQIINRVTELPAGTDETDNHGEIRRVACSQARRTIAKVMSQSWTTIPHVTDSDDADVTELERLRKQYNDQELTPDQPKLTMLAFVIRAVAKGLRLFPMFNASYDADKQEIIYRKYINIAVGVHTERGLIAPVIRDADQLSVPQIAVALAEIAEKARTASFAVNDTRGGTYTISNPGAVGGSRYSTPIVTPPQVAVLATGRTKWMPWVVNGEIAPRFIMPLSHSFDHRIIDGGDEINFMRAIIGELENPGRLVM
ncbi:MAG: 2-oxo acid dehydrogenase subunit E2 [Phycisphaerales bacterium]|nr:MAG: 2-oxo acid dehydrogenase subunit E2 [Phycisphaerales bacterium]